ncbi:Methylated-DNA--protein-cysteine methyltransferase [Pseudonocardia sp. Ae168_Ps1]|nr:Methylated-DNA--protein-cysteine methyltransferase [Pseudonocardia sp. Ae168_Ps1]
MGSDPAALRQAGRSRAGPDARARQPRARRAGAGRRRARRVPARRPHHLRGPVDLSRVEPEHRRVLGELCAIGYGSTRSYGQLARAAELTDDGPRRAGAACARNPVLVVVPCHRIVSATGALTGYSGGLPVKKALLALERGQLALDAAGLTAVVS